MMHSDQIDIPWTTARQMIAEQFPEFSGETIAPVGAMGTVNAIFRIGSRASARFPLRQADPVECRRQLEAEAAAMAAFAACCPVATPQPIGLGQPGPLYPLPWSVQSWIAGEIADPESLAGSGALAADLADLIATLRDVDPVDRSFDGKGRGGRLLDHAEWVEHCLKQSEGLLDLGRLLPLWERLRALPPADRADVMSHRDLIPPNLVVRDGRLAGVLDAGSFGPADPSLDLVAAWTLLDGELRQLLRARLRSTELEWQRGAAWAFIQAIGLVWYYETSNPVMSQLGRRMLDRLLEDARPGGEL